MYVGPISVRDGLLEEIKETVRLINSLPETHPIRLRLTRQGRSSVTVNSFASGALEWLLETLANQEPFLPQRGRKSRPDSTQPREKENDQ